MPEIIGLALLIFVIVVGAIAYLAVYYLRYRWELQGLREEVGRLEAENRRLREENEWLKKAAGVDKE